MVYVVSLSLHKYLPIIAAMGSTSGDEVLSVVPVMGGCVCVCVCVGGGGGGSGGLHNRHTVYTCTHYSTHNPASFPGPPSIPPSIHPRNNSTYDL